MKSEGVVSAFAMCRIAGILSRTTFALPCAKFVVHIAVRRVRTIVATMHASIDTSGITVTVKVRWK